LQLSDRIKVLSALGDLLQTTIDSELDDVINRAYLKNTWFTHENIKKSLAAIADQFLNQTLLETWVADYQISDGPTNKTIGIVMAGNIPLVGFHDLLCNFICGHQTKYKMSSKDDLLLPAIIDKLIEINPACASFFIPVDRLKDYDAVIATGGDTAAVHFEYYFRDYPHIIRKNRNSVAILDGQEDDTELKKLGNDVFDYFGLGCRSVSKLYLPRDYQIKQIFESFYSFKDVIHHNKYKNNYDYNNATLILTNQKFLTNDFLILKEDESIGSRIATLHYEFYDDRQTLLSSLSQHEEELQCISAKDPLESKLYVPLGSCQQPTLSDYADHVDTISFLTSLS